MAKKKQRSKPTKKPGSSHASRRRKRRTTITQVTKTVREVRQNPGKVAGAFAQAGQIVLPAFAAFAATKVLQRIVFSVVGKRWPRFAKHAHALTGLAAFGGVMALGHKVKIIDKHHEGVLIGSGVAALHTIATSYVSPKYSWILGDCKPDPKTLAPADPTVDPDQVTASAGDEYSYLEDELDNATKVKTVRAPRPSATPRADAMAAAGGDAGSDQDLAEYLDSGESVDSLYSGAFGN